MVGTPTFAQLQLRYTSLFLTGFHACILGNKNQITLLKFINFDNYNGKNAKYIEVFIQTNKFSPAFSN